MSINVAPLPKAHNFVTKEKQAREQEAFWNEFYKKAFPNMVGMMSCPGKYESQNRGIDRVIMLSNGRIIKVEEKVRPESSYNDILLEYLSSDKDQLPGWMEKDLEIDYLAYAFIPTRVGYLFDWPILKLTWIRFKQQWFKQYHKVPAQNNGYITYSLAIPIDDLLGAISNTRTVQL